MGGSISKNPKFIQIISTERSINALDENGGVWVYAGSSRGWSQLSEERQGQEREQGQSTEKHRAKPKRRDIPPSWETDDDIPF